MNKNREIQLILDWLRKDFDIDLPDLPKGARRDTMECPVARALRSRFPHVGVFEDNFAEDDRLAFRKVKTPLPPVVAEFIYDFDYGYWPEYLEHV